VNQCVSNVTETIHVVCLWRYCDAFQ